MATKGFVVGLVSSLAQAEVLLGDLKRAGFSRNKISALLANEPGLSDPGCELSPVIAFGPFMAMLGSAAAGATVGGLTGTLFKLGVPSRQIDQYEGKLKAGSILISLHVDDEDEGARLKSIMENNGAQDIVKTSEQRSPQRGTARSLQR